MPHKVSSDYCAIVDTPLPGHHCKLGIVLDAQGLRRIDFLSGDHVCFVNSALPVLNAVLQQLADYFEDPYRFRPPLPIAPQGTKFQQKVWQQLSNSSSGQWTSYGELASILDSSPRAVGNACRRNPIPILVPCHRVLSKSGLGGFAGEQQGEYLQIKRWLLQHESKPESLLLKPVAGGPMLADNVWHYVGRLPV